MQIMRKPFVILFILSFLCPAVSAEIQRKKFSTASAYIVIEVLDDDLVHFEISGIGQGPSINQPLYTSPMVLKTDYVGPSSFLDNGNIFETSQIRLEVNVSNLCVTVKDKPKGNAYLTTICPDELNVPFKGLDIDPGAIQNVYGLGQQFKILGSSDGDWTTFGLREGEGLLGNGFVGFQDAAVGNVQIPVMYAVGNNNLNYALFLDNVYKQKWDFGVFWWKVRMFGDQLRFYIMTGPDLPALRASYMELTGRPPVPPKKSFGLWVSEFGYDNWDQIDTLRKGLLSNDFPLDGFVLDLNWFGGVDLNDGSKSRMGRLDWDEDKTDGNGYFFSDPGLKISQYASDDIGLTAIEESYLASTSFVDTFSQMPAHLTAYQRTNGKCDGNNRSNPAVVEGFWGKGRMIDWSNPDSGKWIHDNRRFPNLTQKGITSHWTDLGEPESINPGACYNGVESTASGVKNEHSDVHNLYNLLWNKSIWDGYFDKRGNANNLGVVNPRPFILARSGAAGIQRYGVAMWSGDIASNLRSLSTHLNAQLHMSFSGIDFYGSDGGGFRREVLPYNNKQGIYRGYDNENYTQWFANSAWFDVPLRPHTDNEFISASPPYSTAPHLLGKKESNLFNTRQRYELIPYYYSLAYRAHLFGEPVVPPPVFYHQNDPNLRKMGHEKLVGKDLLVGVVSAYGEYERDVYLPAGKWINYHTNEWTVSTGQSFKNIPVYRNGIFRLPVFARAGAIIPQMFVDENTKDAFGKRKNNAPAHNELIVKVYADPKASSFTLYEDDGRTLNYDANGRPLYQFRTTEIGQQRVDNTAVAVSILPASNVNSSSPFNGAVDKRQNVVKLVVEDAEATEVSLNGTPLVRQTSESSFNAASSGWFNAGSNLILAKSEPIDVYNTTKTFSFRVHPVIQTTSVNFVCDKGFAKPGESIYVVGNIPALGGPNWNTDRAVKLDPSIYYEYIVSPPAGNNGPGPFAPVWTGIISGIPSNITFEWKCLLKREDGTGEVKWQPGSNNIFTTTSSGYAGRSYGSF
jgi:alpha-glucosidase (family GH31 glycosyl hydrolase)